MERYKSFSAVLFLVAVFFTASGQCPDQAYMPGMPVTMGPGGSICEQAAAADIDCAVFTKCLEKFQHLKVDPLQVSAVTLKFYVPKQTEQDIVKRELGMAEPRAEPKAKPKQSAKPPVSRKWTRKCASVKDHDKYLMETYFLRHGENIFTVAKRYNKNPQVLAWFNCFSNPESLREGQLVEIPDTNFRFWINEDAAPYGSRPLEDALADCDFDDSVKTRMLVLMNNNAYEDGYIQGGQVLKTMASAPLNVNGKRRVHTERNVVVCFENGVANHGRLLKVGRGDSLDIGAVPDVCYNFSTWTELAPPPKLPPKMEKPPLDSTPTPPPPEPPAEAPPSHGVMPPTIKESPVFNRDELFLYGGTYFPVPYLGDVHNYFGGRLALFFPTARGAIFAWGPNLGFNSWRGVGPRDTVPQYHYVGIRPCGGLSLDWLTETSRSTIYLDYAVQIDWGWDRNIPSLRYHERQITQLANPSFAWICALDSYWTRWIGLWVDGAFDLGNVDHVFHHKTSDVGGVSLLKSQAVLHNKSAVDLGFYVFYWDISTARTSLVLGSGVKGLHLWEDNRYEAEIDQLLDINHWLQFGIGYKYTANSSLRLMNGPSFVGYFNLSVLDIGKYKKPDSGW
ncbi:MAG: hypothetical protein PHE24_04920 [Patescibacteria group bacterium]|nr:hypothetical protein [Patescibacteria group bacterium]